MSILFGRTLYKRNVIAANMNSSAFSFGSKTLSNRLKLSPSSAGTPEQTPEADPTVFSGVEVRTTGRHPLHSGTLLEEFGSGEFCNSILLG